MTFEDVIREARRLGLDDEDLDDLVHDAASRAASNINNGGVERQVEYLISEWGEADTLHQLRNMAAPSKCVRVEFDLNYHGGDYNKVGDEVYIPFALVDEIKNPDGKAVYDDDKALKLAFTKVTGYAPEHIIHYTFDEPVDQDG